MTDDNEMHSTHEMVKGLHARFGLFEKRIENMESRMNGFERDLAADQAHLEKHESEAALKGDAVLAKMTAMDNRVEKHIDREEKDRRMLFTLLIGTLASTVATLLTMLVQG